MKNPELFHKTIGILVNAYMNDTLRHYNCCACAVGNLVAANMQLKYNSDCYYEDVFQRPDANNGWAAIFSTTSGKQDKRFALIDKTPMSRKQIDSTGYSIQELAKIEFAFEKKYNWDDSDKARFKGLMSVCDTLMEIHEATTEEIKEAKSLFVKELAV